MGTVSMAQGKGSQLHNRREYDRIGQPFPEHIDRTRENENVTLVDKDIRQAYQEIFGEALTQYNNKQKRADRRIEDYYDHIQKSKNGEKLFYEDVIQWGKKEDFQNPETREVAKAALRDYASTFEQRNPNLRLIGAYIHMDEASPHLHIDYIPVAHGYSRGLSTRNSLDKAMKEMGFAPEKENRKNNATKLWKENERAIFGQICQGKGLTVDAERKSTRANLSVQEYKDARDTMMGELRNELELTQHDLKTAQTALDATQQRHSDLLERNKLYEKTVTTLQAAQSVQLDMDGIQPKKTITGAVKGVTVEQITDLKILAVAKANQDERIKTLEATTADLSWQAKGYTRAVEQAEYFRNENSSLSTELERWRDYGKQRLVRLWNMIVLPLHNRLPQLHIWTFRQARQVSKTEDATIHKLSEAKKEEIQFLENIHGGERKSLEIVLEEKNLSNSDRQRYLADYDYYAVPHERSEQRQFTRNSLDDLLAIARQKQQENSKENGSFSRSRSVDFER